MIGVAMLLVLGIPNSAVAVICAAQERQAVTSPHSSLAFSDALVWFRADLPDQRLAVGYFVIGLISVLCSIFAVRPAPASA